MRIYNSDLCFKFKMQDPSCASDLNRTILAKFLVISAKRAESRVWEELRGSKTGKQRENERVNGEKRLVQLDSRRAVSKS